MAFVRHIFWNSNQGRLRALWRLAIQIALLLAILLPMQIGIGAAAIASLAGQGNTDPGGLVDPQAAQDAILRSPTWLLLSTLGMAVAVSLSVWLTGRVLDRRTFADFGFHIDRSWWADFGFGLGLGATLIGILFGVELAAGWVTVTGAFVTSDPDTGFLAAIVPPLLIFLAVGYYEELLSRGYQLRNMAEGMNGLGPNAAIVLAALLSSAVFGLLHAANPNASAIGTFNIFMAGFLLLGMGYLLTGELAIPIGVHITWNFFQGNVFGFPVSGGSFGSATFIAVEQGGPELWTGGAFGPEAGLLGLVMVGLGSLIILMWVRWRYGRAGLHRAIAHSPNRQISQEKERIQR